MYHRRRFSPCGFFYLSADRFMPEAHFSAAKKKYTTALIV
jgi:hypothetical protein